MIFRSLPSQNHFMTLTQHPFPALLKINELSSHDLLQGCYTDWFSTIKRFYMFLCYISCVTDLVAHSSTPTYCMQNITNVATCSLFSFPSQNTNLEPTRQTEELRQQVYFLLLWSNDLGQSDFTKISNDFSQSKYLLAHRYKKFHFLRL